MMAGEDYEKLKADIEANGQREPIWLHPDGRILDGRNRYIACRDLGLEPRVMQWDGQGSAIDLVVSLNLHRRHLTTSQRAAVAVDVLPMLEEEARERQSTSAVGIYGGQPLKEIIPEAVHGQARDHAATLLGTNGRYVQDAKKLADEAPDLLEGVRAGTLSIPYAMRKLGEGKAAARAQERRNAPAPTKTNTPRLMVGDAAALDLPTESVDVIITSPPYNLGNESWPMAGHGRERREKGIGYEDARQDDEYQSWQLCVLDELYRVAKPGASLFYNHKTRTRDGVLLHPMAWLGKVRGWTLRQEIIWDREVTHNHSATLFWPIDERVYWLTKGKPALYGGSIGMPTVWRFHGPQPYTWHPAPFAEELPRRCLLAIGGSELVVLDPFAGSCTTLKVALDMGHRAIGVDCEAAYLDRARVEYEW